MRLICYALFTFSDLSHRPRKIILFVNPFGGKKKGLQIWEKSVQPLMGIAGVEAKVIVTERAGHIRDILLNCELDSYQVENNNLFLKYTVTAVVG